MEKQRQRGRWSAALYVLALFITVAAAVYQRTTGPTHPVRGELHAGGEVLPWKLIRTASSSADAEISVPAPEGAAAAWLHHKRFRTGDDFVRTRMDREGDDFTGRLPAQPAAGKLEYFVEVEVRDAILRLPDEGRGAVVIRFKDDVPAAALIPHIVLMALSLLLGVRTGLAAVTGGADMRRLTFLTLGAITLGGMILGPVVQKYAFGELWTGYPYGRDLTDNKTLVMWLAWIFGAAAVLVYERKRRWAARLAVLAATLVMISVYLVPHSLGGSELDYEALDRGVEPRDAIETGLK